MQGGSSTFSALLPNVQLCVASFYGVRAGLNNRFQFKGQSFRFSDGKDITQNMDLSSVF
jgi:hypothetical protein